MKPGNNAATKTAPQTMEMLQCLADSLQDEAIILLDPDGIVLTWNQAAERLGGWKAEEIVGQHFSHFHSPEDNASQTTQEELHKAAAQGSFHEIGWRYRKDGSRFWADVTL